jgi:hypothetical protein
VLSNMLKLADKMRDDLGDSLLNKPGSGIR